MIVFELTMPSKGSWNGKWSQEGTCFARTYNQNKVPKEYWNKNFYYRWDDGWTACVSVTQMPFAEARKIERKSKGFCGYDWMIKSIIECGEILTEKERKAMRMIYCYCESCVNHDDDDTCKLDTITISNRELTAAGFLPQCQEYEEEE